MSNLTTEQAPEISSPNERMHSGEWNMAFTHVTIKEPYYHLIQGHLGIYGLWQCELIMNISKGYVVVPVYYNDIFFFR